MKEWSCPCCRSNVGPRIPHNKILLILPSTTERLPTFTQKKAYQLRLRAHFTSDPEKITSWSASNGLGVKTHCSSSAVDNHLQNLIQSRSHHIHSLLESVARDPSPSKSDAVYKCLNLTITPSWPYKWHQRAINFRFRIYYVLSLVRTLRLCRPQQLPSDSFAPQKALRFSSNFQSRTRSWSYPSSLP